MTDLRTAAQAVIASYELGITTRQVYYGHLLERNIETLRQALAEPDSEAGNCEALAKLAERKTVHGWLNDLNIPDTEATGKPMCLLRRLAVALKIQPHTDHIVDVNKMIAEPVEPVVVQVNGHVFHRDGKQFIQFEQKSPSLDVPRITLDDNEWFAFQDKINCPIQDKPELAKLLRRDVDALIAEIDGLGVHTFPNQSSEEFVRLKKLKAILDKYRGVK